MTGRSVCFGLFSLSYLRLECDVDYAYNAPSADSMRNRRGNCFEKNLIFLPTGVRCVTDKRDFNSEKFLGYPHAHDERSLREAGDPVNR